MISVIAGMLVDDQRRVLVGRRSDNGSRPGMWEFPGGKMEAEDRYLLRALIREWREELGVEIRPLRYIDVTELSVEVDLRIELWSIELVDPQAPLVPLVHTELRWVHLFDAVVNLPMVPSMYDFYRKATKRLGDPR